MTEFWNYLGTTTLIIFFVCAQVYPKQTGIAVFLVLSFVFLYPFII